MGGGQTRLKYVAKSVEPVPFQEWLTDHSGKVLL